MRVGNFLLGVLLSVACLPCLTRPVLAQSNSGAISGTVLDPSGGVVVNASVKIHNPVSGYERTAKTDGSGNFNFSNVPFNPYHLSVSAKGFAAYAQDLEVRSSVPVNVKVSLSISGPDSTVTVEGGGDLIETDSTTHTDVDRELIEKLPLESQTSSVSSLVTLASPGIAADSNGLFHGLGDHAENSFSVDGQPITDQQSKVFSNQIPIDSIQSLEVISGAPPAEYGDKTSVVIVATTRSGQGVTTPHGSVTASYGSFGSPSGAFDLSYGGQKWGNFISIGGLNTGRFLDPPEFSVMHDKGNQENLFDRVDYQISGANSVHLNFGYTRSWFQTPNSFDAEFASPWFGVVVDDDGIGPNGVPVGPQDQRSKIQTFNIAPTWTHLISQSIVTNLGFFVRRDAFNYFPSADPFSDLGPPSLQRESVAQDRTLLNTGVVSNVSIVKGIHNFKAGVTYEQTFLDENDHLGIVDPTLNAPCLNAATNVPVQGPAAVTNPAQCAGLGLLPNVVCSPVSGPCDPNAPNTPQFPAFNAVLLPFDLTRGGGLFDFVGHTDVKELSVYAQDTITWKSWSFSLGLREDLYNGLSKANQIEPRLGVAYNIKPTSTVLRISYARTLETPFNENLVLSSIGCSNDVLAPLLGCFGASATSITPGYRNEFHAGLQQAFGKYFVIDGEYIWKYTHNAYDFSVLGNTPITFPIEWHNSKIPGFALRASVPNFHGLTAFVVMSSVAARFFTPQVGGAGAVPSAPQGVFRIDHDERYNQTTHVQYQPFKRAPWFGVTWRFDSGLVAGATPCFGLAATNTCPGSFVDPVKGNTISLVASNAGAVPLSADQEFEAGFFCKGGVQPAPPTAANPAGTPISFGGVVGVCPAANFGSTLIKVPAPGTENDDRNPPRIQQRNLFDFAVGHDNIFGGDRFRWSAQFTVINAANNLALYNFLSTFSGTHYVTPRTLTAQIGFHF
ncbi:MAG TPA: TonB-dependent receptor [Candidatus Sulfotelmatobacter sp.]|nr:TonB-dependent receptor [Candidatus Sulfotelmatobacter sp.]